MSYWIKILDKQWKVLDLLLDWFENLIFSSFLDWVWTWTFQTRTKSWMIALLQVSNSIEIIDIDNNDRVLWRWFIRPFTAEKEITTISLTEIKDKLNYRFKTSYWKYTSIIEVLNDLSIDYDLNMPDMSIDLDYRPKQDYFSILENIKKQTGYDWSYDWSKITFWRVWDKVTDLFLGTWEWNECNNSWSNLIWINNPSAKFTEQYNRVLAFWNDNLFYELWTWDIESVITIDTDDIWKLEDSAIEHLEYWKSRRIISFEVTSRKSNLLNVWDYINISIQEWSDIFDIDAEVRILKKELIFNWCDFISNISVSEAKNIVRDEFNIINSLASRFNYIESKI